MVDPRHDSRGQVGNVLIEPGFIDRSELGDIGDRVFRKSRLRTRNSDVSGEVCIAQIRRQGENDDSGQMTLIELVVLHNQNWSAIARLGIPWLAQIHPPNLATMQ